MRAAFYEQYGPAGEVLQVGDLPDLAPGPGEVRVRLGASAVNPSDVKARAGSRGPMEWPRIVPHSDGAGTIYAADNFTRIRKISRGTITTFAGAGFGFNGDKLWPLLTNFDDPIDVAVDSKGVVYVVDDFDHRIRTIK